MGHGKIFFVKTYGFLGFGFGVVEEEAVVRELDPDFDLSATQSHCLALLLQHLSSQIAYNSTNIAERLGQHETKRTLSPNNLYGNWWVSYLPLQFALG